MSRRPKLRTQTQTATPATQSVSTRAHTTVGTGRSCTSVRMTRPFWPKAAAQAPPPPPHPPAPSMTRASARRKCRWAPTRADWLTGWLAKGYRQSLTTATSVLLSSPKALYFTEFRQRDDHKGPLSSSVLGSASYYQHYHHYQIAF